MKTKASLSRKQAKVGSKRTGWAIGRVRFAKISAVEGIAVTPVMKARKAEFDRTGASDAQRRAAIIKTYKA